MKKVIRLLVSALIVFLTVFCWCFETNAHISSELRIQRTDTSNGYRLDFVDETGRVSLAEDKGYATVVYEVVANHWISEHYYDEYMNPVSPNSYHGVLYDYEEGYCSSVTFVDENDNPTMNSLGYSIRKQTVDEYGWITQENYYDCEGNPVAISGGYYGLRREMFDENGRAVRYSYLDETDNLYLFNDCYSTVICEYNSLGFVESEFYLDRSGNSVKNADGVYGITYIRDANGNDIGFICLDDNGNRMAATAGYSILLYSRNRFNNYDYLSYYDAEGNPIELSQGQHTELRIYQGKDLLDVYYYNNDGDPIFLLDAFLQYHILFNAAMATLIVLLCFYATNKLRSILLVLYSLFIIYITLLCREMHFSTVNYDLIQSFKLFVSSLSSRREIVNNVILFIPFGFIIYSIKSRRCVVLFSLLLSVLIEVMQLTIGLGTFELNDIIENFLGGAIGVMLCWGLLFVRNSINRSSIGMQNMDN